MKIITGTVVSDRIELPPRILPEGSCVAVLAADDEEPIRLDAEQEREIAESVAEIRRGEYVDGKQLLADLWARARR